MKTTKEIYEEEAIALVEEKKIKEREEKQSEFRLMEEVIMKKFCLSPPDAEIIHGTHGKFIYPITRVRIFEDMFDVYSFDYDKVEICLVASIYILSEGHKKFFVTDKLSYGEFISKKQKSSIQLPKPQAHNDSRLIEYIDAIVPPARVINENKKSNLLTNIFNKIKKLSRT